MIVTDPGVGYRWAAQAKGEETVRSEPVS